MDFLLAPFLAKECPPTARPRPRWNPLNALPVAERPRFHGCASMSPLTEVFPEPRTPPWRACWGFSARKTRRAGAQLGSWAHSWAVRHGCENAPGRLGRNVSTTALPCKKQSPDPASKAVLGCGMQSFQKFNTVYQAAAYNRNGWPLASALFFFSAILRPPNIDGGGYGFPAITKAT